MVNFPPEGSKEEPAFMKNYYRGLEREALDIQSLLAMAYRQLEQAWNKIQRMDSELFQPPEEEIGQASDDVKEAINEMSSYIQDIRSERVEW